VSLLSSPRRARAMTGLAVAGAMTLAACGGGDGGDSGNGSGDDVVTIDFLQPLPKSMAFYPLFVGEQLGYFEEEGIEVNLLPSGDVPATVIVPTGRADIGATAASFIMQAAATGEDFVVPYEYYQKNVFSMVTTSDSGVTEIADLEGANIGITSEAAGDAGLARSALQSAGLTPGEDVTVTVAGEGGPAVAEALRTGELDAFTGAFNDIVALSVALKSEGIELVDITPDSFAIFPASSMVVTTETLENDRDVLVRFLRAWAKATYAGLESPDMVYGMAREEVPEETADEEFGRAFLEASVTLQEPAAGTDRFGEVRPEAWDAVQEDLIAGGELEEAVDMEPYLDNSLIDDVNDWDRAEVEQEVEDWLAENE
jgi:NitT/TauT family transport system substrate-binding protein